MADKPVLCKFDSPIFAVAAVNAGSGGDFVLAAGGGGSARTGILNQIVSIAMLLTL